MLEVLNFLLLKAKALAAVCLKYAAGDGKEGISAGDIQTLQAAIADAEASNTDQEKAVSNEEKLTDLQNQTMAKAHNLLRKTQDAAEAEYGDNKARRKEFHIGGPKIASVKAMGTELKYAKSVAIDNLAALKKHGFKDADIAKFDTLSTELDTNATNQKNARKVQKAATADRDATVKDLRKAISEVQKSAKVVFQDQSSILVEFESISDSHGGGGKKPPTPPPDQTKPPSK